jgi:hypothetical protein
VGTRREAEATANGAGVDGQGKAPPPLALHIPTTNLA